MIDQNFNVRSEDIREIHVMHKNRVLYCICLQIMQRNTMTLGKQHKQIQCANDLYFYKNKTTFD